MGIALKNPGDTSKRNALARILVKKAVGRKPGQPFTAAHEAKLAALRGDALKKEAEKLVRDFLTLKDAQVHAPMRTLKEEHGMSRRGQNSGSYLLREGDSLPSSKESKKALARAKRAILNAFGELGGEGYGPKSVVINGKDGRFKSVKQSYATRASKGKASRYKKKGKKMPASARYPHRKESGLGSYMVARPYGDDSITEWNESRVFRRAKGLWGHQFPENNDEAFDSAFAKQAREGRLPLATKRRAWNGNQIVEGLSFASEHPTAPDRASASSYAAGEVEGDPSTKKFYQVPSKAKRQQGITSNSRFLDGAPARSNGLALENPSFRGVTSYVTGYAVPVVVTGGVAGGAHGLLACYGVTDKLSSCAGKVPLVGTFVEERLPFTLQGLVVGTALAAVAPMLGTTVGKYAALTGGAALVFGAGIDTFNFAMARCVEAEVDAAASLEADLGALALGGLALDNTSTLAGLAVENTSALGDLALTNGALDSDDLYGQASFADAHYCGADFSVEEGQALLNGKSSWTSMFGTPSVRMSSRPVLGASHLAGKPGHRWGWLIRLVGFERACAICALPPQKRVQMIAKLRQAAITAFQAQQAKEAVHAETPLGDDLPAAGSVAEGAEGATNYLGDPALFMGA